MNIGSVLFHKDFTFHDGKMSNKLIIVLGFIGEVYVIAKTTSQPTGKGNTYGCQPDDRFHNFYLPQKSCYFEKCTWICLDEFYELRKGHFLQKISEGNVNQLFLLTKEQLKNLQECALKSLDITGKQVNIIKASM